MMPKALKPYAMSHALQSDAVRSSITDPTFSVNSSVPFQLKSELQAATRAVRSSICSATSFNSPIGPVSSEI